MKKLIALMAGAALTVVACGGSEVSETDDASFESGGATETEASSTDAPATDPPATEPAATEPADTDAPPETEPVVAGDSDGVLNVPDEFATIQEAVDAAVAGDLVLIAPGVYNEAVDVVTDEIVIRGLEREGVVLDGQFELDNGVRVLGARGVAVENLTTQNYTGNGVFFTAADGYRASYVTAYRNGDYGIYAFDSVNGLFDNSYGAGSPDAGFYIGQCYPCNAVMDNVIAEHNGLGYSGTTSGGNLFIINSRFNNNRAGINMNSATYELCYPQRQTTVAGNLVYSNNQPDTPAIDDAILAMNNGILVEGGIGNVITRNRVFDHVKTGIGLVPFPEFEPNDVEPPESQWEAPCEETREIPLAGEGDIVPILWAPKNNTVNGNVVEQSGAADIAIAAVGLDLAPLDPTQLGNCFADNQVSSSAPTDVEALLPCDGEGSGGDWLLGDLQVATWLADAEVAPPSVDYQIAELPPIPDLEDMPDAATAPASAATNMPPAVDLDSIAVPPMPSE